jgi:hypothetical protein
MYPASKSVKAQFDGTEEYGYEIGESEFDSGAERCIIW